MHFLNPSGYTGIPAKIRQLSAYNYYWYAKNIVLWLQRRYKILVKHQAASETSQARRVQGSGISAFIGMPYTKFFIRCSMRAL